MRLFLFIFLLLEASISLAQSASLELIASRRKVDLATFPTPQDLSSITIWISSQKIDGTWSDVDYTAGCPAQRANWPIQQHWIRVITFAAAWIGLNPSSPSSWAGDVNILAAAQKGMDYWFANDFTSNDCIGLGGYTNATCPCGTPGLWNTNWFDQIILIPQLVTTACLLIDTKLTPSEITGCYNIPIRAYERRDDFINGLGYLTGANAINVMQNSVSLALYTNNATILEDSLDRAMASVTFSDAAVADGIHRDGSFLQHNGILYSGNYGMNLIDAFIQLEGEAIGTEYAANNTVREAFAVDVQGSEWMIYVDQQTKVEHWDFNVIGRFIAFPTPDLQASADINFNVTLLAAATADFTGENNLNATIRRLSSNGTEKLTGNKMFYASDYMIHRRDQFILTNKMISTRSRNTEYTNSANPYGYHLGQGTLFSYVNGYEYRDIEAGWDWNLIPGTTILLDKPKLNSPTVGYPGKKSYVGGASDGWVGTSVEDYVDPYDASLSYRKAWFYLDDSVLVVTSNVSVNSSVASVGSAPVITVLDNRLAASGGIFVDGVTVGPTNRSINGTSLYYGGNGYYSYGTPFNLTLSEGYRTGNWTAISTSVAGNTTVPIFSAYTTIPFDYYAYAFFPGCDASRTLTEASAPTTYPLYINNTLGAAGVERLSLVFFPNSTTSATVDMSQIGWGSGTFTVSTSDAGIYLFATRDNVDGTRTLVVTLADPSQSLTKMLFSLAAQGASLACAGSQEPDDGCTSSGKGVSFIVDLPTHGSAGDSVFREVTLS